MRVSNIEAMRSQIKGKHILNEKTNQGETEGHAQHSEVMANRDLFRQSSNALFASGAQKQKKEGKTSPGSPTQFTKSPQPFAGLEGTQ